MNDHTLNITGYKLLILEKLYKMWDEDWEEIAYDFCCETGIPLTPDQCKTLVNQLGLPLQTIKTSSISKDDFDYASSLRQGLGLSFYIDTKKEVIYRSCKNYAHKMHCLNSSNCMIYTKGKYILCEYALFVCANTQFRCPKNKCYITANDKFDIDHIISFKKYWSSLKRVNIEEVKRWYNNVDNLQIMCPYCNRRLGGK